MLVLLESLIAEALALSTTLFPLLGAHEISRVPPKKFITVRQGREAVLVER